MRLITLVGFVTCASFALGQHQNYFDYEYQAQSPARAVPNAGISRVSAQVKPTPVPIIKQINRHNDDGSYTYGYEGADGSFKIETKLPTGEVSGKYGYVDDSGKLRVVDYGANRYGFQPAGDGITVAPPTLVDETTDKTKETGGLADYDRETILYAARPQVQSTAKPVAAVGRQQKRPRPSSVRPIQYVPQPQFVPYEVAAGVQADVAPAPALPTAIPVQHFQGLQQAPALFPQQQGQPQFHHQQQQQQQQQQHFPQAYFTYEQQRPVTEIAQTPARAQAVPVPLAVPGAAPSGPLFRPHSLRTPVVAPVSPAPVREHNARTSGPSSSVLDSLIQQYALPKGVGQPLHDISFGSYAGQTNY